MSTGLVGDELLRPVLILRGLQALRVRDAHAAVLRLPPVPRPRSDAVPPAQLVCRRSTLMLPEHADDSFLRDRLFLMGPPGLLLTPSRFPQRMVSFSGGRVMALKGGPGQGGVSHGQWRCNCAWGGLSRRLRLCDFHLGSKREPTAQSTVGEAGLRHRSPHVCGSTSSISR